MAVANRIVVLEPSVWDLGPAWSGLAALWRDFIRSLPFFLVGLFILALSAVAGMLATGGAKEFLRQRIEARLLRTVIAGTVGVLVFLVGTYIVLRVSGLTQLALTVSAAQASSAWRSASLSGTSPRTSWPASS